MSTPTRQVPGLLRVSTALQFEMVTQSPSFMHRRALFIQLSTQPGIFKRKNFSLYWGHSYWVFWGFLPNYTCVVNQGSPPTRKGEALQLGSSIWGSLQHQAHHRPKASYLIRLLSLLPSSPVIYSSAQIPSFVFPK